MILKKEDVGDINTTNINVVTALNGCAHNCGCFELDIERFRTNEEHLWSVYKCANLKTCETVLEKLKQKDDQTD